VRKARRTPAEARLAVEGWQTTPSAFASAMALSSGHSMDIWDTTIIAVAAEAGCHLLLSEDLSQGFNWRGLTVINPFAAKPHPMLQAL
jgi:predicted nucleic acid-binding protein